MSHLLDQRAFGYKGLLRAIRTFVCGYPQLDQFTIDQGGAGSVGSGEAFAASGPTGVAGRILLTCTTGGGAGVAQFSVAYSSTGSPPSVPSPIPTFSGTLVADTQFEENDIWLYVDTTVDWAVGNLINVDLIASTNTTPWAERRFVTDSDKSPQFGTELEWFTQGPGDGSPQSNITMGYLTVTSGSNVRNIRQSYFTAFTDTSPETDFLSQPGLGGTVYLHSDESPMDYWITVNSRRFIVAARHVGGQWESIYAGFLEPLAGIASYPYPICSGGMSVDDTQQLTWVDVKHSAWWDPGGNTAATTGSLYVRTPVGGDQVFANKTDAAAEPGEFNTTAIDNVVWPYGNTHQIQGNQTFLREFLQKAARTPFFGSPQAREFVLYRAQLFSVDFAAAEQTIGFLDGVFWISSEAVGLAGGDTFILESPEVTYLVLQNAFRGVTRESLAAIRMDPD